MSDEESFVILGSSPMPSMVSDVERQQQQLREAADSIQTSAETLVNSVSPLASTVPLTNNKDGDSTQQLTSDCIRVEVAGQQAPGVQPEMANSVMIGSVRSTGSAQERNDVASVKDSSINGTNNAPNSNAAITDTCAAESAKTTQNDNNNKQPASLISMGSSTISGGGGSANASRNTSLAASFILGEVDAEVLKTSVYSQFPSLSMQACAEDIIKFQSIMEEYLKMKDMLLKVNTNIKLLYDRTHHWKQTMQNMESTYKQQIAECQTQIATLRNENLNLKRDIESKMEQMKICEDVRASEQSELIQSLSEKMAQIANMRSQIEKLEVQQLASFEYIAKNEHDSKEKPDYVDRLEHERVVKDFERKMSVLLAEKLEVSDMQKQYIDEINCLKVNQIAAEELIKQLRADITLLKAKDDEKTAQFCQYEEERERTREEFALLRQQVDVYSKDFEIERIARQELAGEKDQLLQDLHALQRKNQELVEEAQRQFASIEQRISTASNLTSSSTSVAASSVSRTIRPLPPPSPTDLENGKHRCPVCSKTCVSLSVLENHVNRCLDMN